MLIHHDPDEWETVSDSRTCRFHEKNPGKTYAGCTCSASYGLRLRAPEDVVRIKAERRGAEEDAILARAEAIKFRRKQTRRSS